MEALRIEPQATSIGMHRFRTLAVFQALLGYHLPNCWMAGDAVMILPLRGSDIAVPSWQGDLSESRMAGTQRRVADRISSTVGGAMRIVDAKAC